MYHEPTELKQTEIPNPNPFKQLPTAVVGHILSYACSKDEIRDVSRTCKTFYKAAGECKGQFAHGPWSTFHPTDKGAQITLSDDRKTASCDGLEIGRGYSMTARA